MRARRPHHRDEPEGTAELLRVYGDSLLARHFSRRTIEAYLGWTTRYVRHHGAAAPSALRALGGRGVDGFLTALAREGLSASTQNQARAALVHLLRDVLREPVQQTEAVVRARRPTKVPTILTRDEALRVLHELPAELRLPVGMLYGSGLRLLECLALRVKDVDLAYRTVTVRGGKGAKDRTTTLAEALVGPLRTHLAERRTAWERDLAVGIDGCTLPEGLQRKLPGACRAWEWQYVFAASRTLTDDTGRRCRHHMHESVLQRAVPEAARAAEVAKRVSCHTFRHSFATHLLEDGYDIRQVQELMGHEDVRTTMGYLHVVKRGGLSVRSPLDGAVRGRRRANSGDREAG